MIRKYSDLIILLILWIVSIYSGILVATGQYEIGLQNYFGYSLLILITALRFLKVRKIKTVLGVFLIFGSLNLIQFTCSTVTFFLTWKPPGHEFTFGIQPLSLFLLLFLALTTFHTSRRQFQTCSRKIRKRHWKDRNNLTSIIIKNLDC